MTSDEKLDEDGYITTSKLYFIIGVVFIIIFAIGVKRYIKK